MLWVKLSSMPTPTPSSAFRIINRATALDSASSMSPTVTHMTLAHQVNYFSTPSGKLFRLLDYEVH